MFRKLREDVSSLFEVDGKASESKMFSVLGKCICAYILVKHHTDFFSADNEWILFILVTALIMPALFAKVVSMRAGMTIEEEKAVVVARADVEKEAVRARADVERAAVTARQGSKVDSPDDDVIVRGDVTVKGDVVVKEDVPKTRRR